MCMACFSYGIETNAIFKNLISERNVAECKYEEANKQINKETNGRTHDTNEQANNVKKAKKSVSTLYPFSYFPFVRP